MSGPSFFILAACVSGGEAPGVAPHNRAPFIALDEGSRGTIDAAHPTLSAQASVEADAPPVSPRRSVGRGVGLPAPRPVRHFIARWQQAAAVRAEDRAVREGRWT